MSAIIHNYEVEIAPDGDIFFTCPLCGRTKVLEADGNLRTVERGDVCVEHRGSTGGFTIIGVDLSGNQT